LAPETELESILVAGAKSLWYGVTFPVRVLAKAGALVLPRRWTHSPTHAERHGLLVGQAAVDYKTLREPYKGEAIEELHDALSPSYDQLRLVRGWWILEWVPLRQKKGNAVFTSSNQSHNFHWLYVVLYALFRDAHTPAGLTVEMGGRCSRPSSSAA
jgi:hypothetical protein